MSQRRAAIFLDRDGTMIDDVGVLKDPDGIILYPDTVEALKELQKDYLLFVITNQSAVADGLISLEDVDKVNHALDIMLQEQGVRIEEWYSCPHKTEDNCDCKKPKPAFVLKAAEDYGLDLKRSFVIGDHPHDVCTGQEYGVFGLYVLTGHGVKHLDELEKNKLMFHSLSDAVVWINSHPNNIFDLEKNIEDGAKAIQKGQLVAFPTETVYGLGADVFNPEAVEQIFIAKKRPKNNPFIVHISDEAQLNLLIDGTISNKAQRLIDKFWPGPLTLILPKSKNVPDIVTANNSTVGIRMPASRIALEFIKRAGTPIAAPSANSFNYVSPTAANHVRNSLDGAFSVIIDGGACNVGVESTVISLVDNRAKILRPGGISKEEIETVIGNVEISEGDAINKIESPGQFQVHYAPETPLEICERFPQEYIDDADVGFMLHEPPSVNYAGPIEILSDKGDPKEIAMNLYAALRRLDKKGLKLIVTSYFADESIGAAINNRLKKASSRRRV